MKKNNGCIVITALLLLFVSQPLCAADLLITNARLIDATGAEPREGVSILIRDGLIAAISDNATAGDVQVIDVQGATVLPGLIDGHVHLELGPGAFMYKSDMLVNTERAFNIEYWRQTYGKYILQYMRAYLACGITTVLDAASHVEIIHEVRNLLLSDNPGPRFLPLGPFLSPANGYGVFAPGVTTVEEVKAFFDAMEELGTVGVKTSVEKGWAPRTELPLFSEELREAIRQESQQRNLPLYIHTTSEEDHRIALTMEPRAFMHTVTYRDEKLSDDFIAEMAATDTYQVTTLGIIDSELTFWNRERLEDPLLELVVPPRELSRARNVFLCRYAQRQMFRGVPPIIKFIIARRFFAEDILRAQLDVSQDAIRRLHESGVKIVAGCDTPARSDVMFMFHGPSMLREVELIGQAGLTNMEAIQTATINAAKMLGLDDEIGTVEAGKRADLMIVRQDPLADLANLKTVIYTVQDGIAKTPQQWMQE